MKRSDQSSLSVVVFAPTQSAASDPSYTHLVAAVRMLVEMGHRVTETDTLRDLAGALTDPAGADLLVTDVRSDAEASALTSVLLSLTARPTRVVVTTGSNEGAKSLVTLREGIRPVPVHVILRPILIHGLLHVLRQFEQGSQTVPA